MSDRVSKPISILLAETELALKKECESEPFLIQEIFSYALSGGGKRIRPVLFLLSAKACNARNEKLPKLAAAIELIHTASLLHDDIVDGSSKRRWRDSVNAKWGNSMGVLIGDKMWLKALSIVLDAGNERIMQIASNAIEKIIRAEINETLARDPLGLCIEEYVKIISGKTAELFSFSGKLGAMIAEEGQEIADLCSKIGLNLGIAFQLMDDARDYSSLEAVTGKPACQDLLSGRVTFPLIASIQEMNETVRQKIREIFLDGEIKDSAAAFVCEEVCKHGGVEKTIQLAKDYSKKAVGLAQILPKNGYSDSISALINEVCV